MITKDGLIFTIKDLGFVMEKESSKGGSHRVFTHKIYKNIHMGVVDHQNTKEISRIVYNQTIKTITLLMWIKYRNEKNKVDIVKANKDLKNIDKELANKVISQLKKINAEEQVNLSILLCDSLVSSIESSNNGKLNLENVIKYCSSTESWNFI